MGAQTDHLDLVDGDGRRLQVVWSRTRKSIGIAAILRRSHGYGYAQVGLARDQLEAFTAFLRGQPANHPAKDAKAPDLELDDPDSEHGRLQAAWNPQGNRVALTIVPSTPWDGDSPAVNLTSDQATALANFLSVHPAAKR
jgi:hypothetical protein